LSAALKSPAVDWVAALYVVFVSLIFWAVYVSPVTCPFASRWAFTPVSTVYSEFKAYVPVVPVSVAVSSELALAEGV
jgi:hypothetical protein